MNTNQIDSKSKYCNKDDFTKLLSDDIIEIFKYLFNWLLLKDIRNYKKQKTNN